MSQLIESSQPPPRAKPLTAAITGTGNFSSLRNTSFPFLPKASPSSLLRLLISPMSAPATKDFCPAPVTIRQRTVPRSTWSRTLSSSSNTAEFRAFKAFSRLIVIIAYSPFCSYTINSILISYSSCVSALPHRDCFNNILIFYLYNGGAAHAAADTQCGKSCLCSLGLHFM